MPNPKNLAHYYLPQEPEPFVREYGWLYISTDMMKDIFSPSMACDETWSDGTKTWVGVGFVNFEFHQIKDANGGQAFYRRPLVDPRNPFYYLVPLDGIVEIGDEFSRAGFHWRPMPDNSAGSSISEAFLNEIFAVRRNSLVSATPRHDNKIVIGKDGWQANTKENPFWKDSQHASYGGTMGLAVEVLFHDGTIKIFKCPKCNSRSFDLVKAWRKVER